MALGRSIRTAWLGSVAVGGALLVFGLGCGGDDESTGAGGATTSSTSTTFTYTTTTTTTTGAGGSGGSDVDPTVCADGWAKYTDECGLGAGTGGGGGGGGAESAPACDKYQTCWSRCYLESTCQEIEQGLPNYTDCTDCCDDYNGC